MLRTDGVSYHGDEPIYAGDPRLIDEMLAESRSTESELLASCNAYEGLAPGELLAEYFDAAVEVLRRERQYNAIYCLAW